MFLWFPTSILEQLNKKQAYVVILALFYSMCSFFAQDINTWLVVDDVNVPNAQLDSFCLNTDSQLCQVKITFSKCNAVKFYYFIQDNQNTQARCKYTSKM